jgi:hypothetical protein
MAAAGMPDGRAGVQVRGAFHGAAKSVTR